MVLNYIYTDRIDPTKRTDDAFGKVEDPQSNRIVLLMMDVYRLAVQFNMDRLERLCVNYLEATISHANVLVALHNAVHLKLYFIKEFCLSFVVKESNYNQIVMSQEFETLDQPLMVEIIRRRQMPQTRNFTKYEYESGVGTYFTQFTFACSLVEFLSCKRNFVTHYEVRLPGTSLEQDMKAFLNSVGLEFCDINLMLDGLLIPAHKAVLAARCSYFEAMFRSFMPENNMVNVSIHNLRLLFLCRGHLNG